MIVKVFYEAIKHIFFTLWRYGPPAKAIKGPDFAEKEAQILIDLGDGGHG